MKRRAAMLCLLALIAAGALRARPAQRATASLVDVQNVIVIYQENWSFDSLFGFFPGANGIANAKDDTIRQEDKNGKAYTTLPQPVDNRLNPPAPDPRFPASLPVAPFDVAKYVKPEDTTGNPLHRFYQQQLQINNGDMNRFVAWSDASGLAMSYYDATNFPEGKLAQEFTLADNFFMAAFGGSFLNHMWLICACTPTWPNAPADMVAQVEKDGSIIKDGAVTSDGFVVNNVNPLSMPYPANATGPARRLPPQTMPTIGDRLTGRNIDWRYYSGGYDNAMARKPGGLFQVHHQPFVYFEKYVAGTEFNKEFLKDEKVFYDDLKKNTLPSVSFIKLIGEENEHPGYASLMRGQQKVAQIVDLVRKSPYWNKSVIFITYDDNGGRWDHVAPPKIDRWGPGVRIPAIIVSPFAKKNYVDHTLYDTTSIMAFIERRWNLRPVGTRDARMSDLTSAFEFTR